MKNLWEMLTRERPPFWKRAAARGRAAGDSRGKRGIALLVVLLAITLITAVVVQFSLDAHVDYSLAQNEADETRAYYLAISGINFYKLILDADQKLASNQQLTQFLQSQGMAGISLWKMIPQIDTALLRSVASPDIAPDQKDEISKQFGGVAFDSLTKTDGFLDFEGDIHVEIVGEDAKLNLNHIADERINTPLDSSIGRALYAMAASDKYDTIFDGTNALGERKLARDEVVGNIIDWIDPDQVGIKSGGSEDNLYTVYENPYKAKNAPFDSVAEVGMVAGVNDDWMAAFGDKITVYSSGKIDLNSCSAETIAGILLAVSNIAIQPDEAMEMAKKTVQYRELAPFTKPADFVTFVSTTFGITIPATYATNFLGVASTVFTVKSTGLVGTSRVTITAVVDNTGSSLRWLYWRVN